MSQSSNKCVNTRNSSHPSVHHTEERWNNTNVRNSYDSQLHSMKLDFCIDIPKRKIKSFYAERIINLFQFVHWKFFQRKWITWSLHKIVLFLHIIRLWRKQNEQKKNKEIFKRKEKKKKIQQHSFISRGISFQIYMNIFSSRKFPNFSVERIYWCGNS